MTKVSVVTTVYNGQKWFDRAVPSILGQDADDFEWVIVDDGSYDRTLELLKQVAARDPRVKVHAAGRLGRAQALNRAVELAAGEYIAIQDFDDVSANDRLRLQAEFLDRHPEVGVVGAHYVVVDEIRGEEYIRKPPCEHADLARAMAVRIPFAHTVTMFRKQAWRDAGGYPVVGQLIDYRLWLEIGRVQFLGDLSGPPAHPGDRLPARMGWKFATIPAVLGTHWIYQGSYWKTYYSYGHGQRAMAANQARAIRALRLAPWRYVYPAGRVLYLALPTAAKRWARRWIGGSKETDLSHWT